jgi:hypothetical protein
MWTDGQTDRQGKANGRLSADNTPEEEKFRKSVFSTGTAYTYPLVYEVKMQRKVDVCREDMQQRKNKE